MYLFLRQTGLRMRDLTAPQFTVEMSRVCVCARARVRACRTSLNAFCCLSWSSFVISQCFVFTSDRTADAWFNCATVYCRDVARTRVCVCVCVQNVSKCLLLFIMVQLCNFAVFCLATFWRMRHWIRVAVRTRREAWRARRWETFRSHVLRSRTGWTLWN